MRGILEYNDMSFLHNTMTTVERDNTKNHPFNNLELSAIAEFMSVQLPNCNGKCIKRVFSPGFAPLVIAVL